MKSGARWLSAVCLFVGFFLLAQVIVLARVKASLTDLASEHLGPGLRVETLRWYFPLAFGFLNIRFLDEQGASWFHADSITAKLRCEGLYPLRFGLQSLHLKQPRLRMVRKETGEWEDAGNRALAMWGAILQSMGLSAGLEEPDTGTRLSVEDAFFEVSFLGDETVRVTVSDVWMKATRSQQRLAEEADRIHVEFRGRFGDRSERPSGHLSGYTWFNWPISSLVASLNLEGVSLSYLAPVVPRPLRVFADGEADALVDAQAQGGELWAECDAMIANLVLQESSEDDAEVLGFSRNTAVAFLDRSGGRIPLDLKIEGSLDDPDSFKITRLYSTLFKQATDRLMPLPINDLVESRESLSEIIVGEDASLAPRMELDDLFKAPVDPAPEMSEPVAPQTPSLPHTKGTDPQVDEETPILGVTEDFTTAGETSQEEHRQQQSMLVPL